MKRCKKLLVVATLAWLCGLPDSSSDYAMLFILHSDDAIVFLRDARPGLLARVRYDA